MQSAVSLSYFLSFIFFFLGHTEELSRPLPPSLPAMISAAAEHFVTPPPAASATLPRQLKSTFGQAELEEKELLSAPATQPLAGVSPRGDIVGWFETSKQE